MIVTKTVIICHVWRDATDAHVMKATNYHLMEQHVKVINLVYADFVVCLLGGHKVIQKRLAVIILTSLPIFVLFTMSQYRMCSSLVVECTYLAYMNNTECQQLVVWNAISLPDSIHKIKFLENYVLWIIIRMLCKCIGSDLTFHTIILYKILAVKVNVTIIIITTFHFQFSIPLLSHSMSSWTPQIKQQRHKGGTHSRTTKHKESH